MDRFEPENTIRTVVDGCADCDVCRYLMDSSCFMFPELYRLFDKEMETGEKISSAELRHLVDLCNFCALCPCPDVRADVMTAKTLFIDRDGLSFSIRRLEDVEGLSKLCGAYPRLTNTLLQSRFAGGLLRKVAGIHQERRIPEFSKNDFPSWVAKQGYDCKSPQKQMKKVAYFAGCTGKYLFPEVPRAVVEVLRNNGVEVYYPKQQCCGMPSMLEGDRKLTLKFLEPNIEHLAEVVGDGYSIVCSCPTCGFMLKKVLKENAYYSPEYQELIGADQVYLKIPAEGRRGSRRDKDFVYLNKTIFSAILKDEGYFSSINPLKRITVAENAFDLGEYLGRLHEDGEFRTELGPVTAGAVYYPPCHLREQNIGSPYLDLLNLIPGLTVELLGSNFYCCGIAGIMGFKREFHQHSVAMGDTLVKRIRELDPQRLITDCLSCRLQFNQLTSYKVFHPIEIIREAYAGY